MHRCRHVLPRWNTACVPLVIGQHHHIILLISALPQELLDVVDVVDAASQLALLTKVVDTDQKRFTFALHRRVLVAHVAVHHTTLRIVVDIVSCVFGWTNGSALRSIAIAGLTLHTTSRGAIGGA